VKREGGTYRLGGLVSPSDGTTPPATEGSNPRSWDRVLPTVTTSEVNEASGGGDQGLGGMPQVGPRPITKEGAISDFTARPRARVRWRRVARVHPSSRAGGRVLPIVRPHRHPWKHAGPRVRATARTGGGEPSGGCGHPGFRSSALGMPSGRWREVGGGMAAGGLGGDSPPAVGAAFPEWAIAGAGMAHLVTPGR
jgi:hypothetical protein